jgi:hypothetical protein
MSEAVINKVVTLATPHGSTMVRLDEISNITLGCRVGKVFLKNGVMLYIPLNATVALGKIWYEFVTGDVWDEQEATEQKEMWDHYDVTPEELAEAEVQRRIDEAVEAALEEAEQTQEEAAE